MGILKGISYNVRGLMMGLQDRRLFWWGVSRFILMIIVVSFLAGLILGFSQDIMRMIWERPEKQWLAWIWHALSWLISALLMGISFLFSYIISQILFSVLIMDHMSKIVEKKINGAVQQSEKGTLGLFLYLIGQEIPRAVLPIGISAVLFVLGWFVPMGPIVSILSALAAAVFLAWDNTDIVAARRMVPFKERFRLLMGSLPFHVGFGLPFLIPFLNIAFLAFAPVGGTLYFLEKDKVS